ncbi:MAG: permease prefix domain 2-containing transporter [Chloroflexi bacterium]|nr:permease prefix domain 2-containing transporter [Chloroflexota bacterium]
MRPVAPPQLAVKILRALLPTAAGEALLGDLAEIYQGWVEEQGLGIANRWYWFEIFSAAPALVLHLLKTTNIWRQTVNGPSFVQSGRKTALWSALFLIPAVLLVIPGLMDSLLGSNGGYQLVARIPFLQGRELLDSPWIIIGGLTIAIALNLLAILNVKNESSDTVWRVAVEIRKNAWNLIPVVFAAMLGTTIFLYLIGENLGPLF